MFYKKRIQFYLVGNCIMDYTNYEDTIENTDGIYTGFSEELPYRKDADLDIPKMEDVAPLILLASTRKKTKKNKKTKRKKINKKRGLRKKPTKRLPLKP